MAKTQAGHGAPQLSWPHALHSLMQLIQGLMQTRSQQARFYKARADFSHPKTGFPFCCHVWESPKGKVCCLSFKGQSQRHLLEIEMLVM